MPTTIPVDSVSSPLSIHSYCFLEANSVSEAGISIATAIDVIRKSSESSEVLFGPKHELLRELHELCQNCNVDGWDGAEAARIQGRTMAIAENLIRSISFSSPAPELAPVPDGSISFDWMVAPQKVVTAFIGPDLEIPFAWINGNESGYGVASFDSIDFPAKLRNQIIALMK